MKIEEVTVEQFAKWTLERDHESGCFDDEPEISKEWDQLPEDYKESYLEEATYYVNEHPHDDWPVDILERLHG